MKIASWNVNSIKARETHVRDWLETNDPDILMLQELKGTDMPGFGRPVQVAAQKTYNGVAILSKEPSEKILDRLPGDDMDEQARYLEVDYKGVRLINIYLPNGNPVDTDKYPYKLAWMDRLYARLKTLREQKIPFLIGGDFNIIPDERDCYDPAAWVNDALFKPESRAKFRALLNLGLFDAFRILEESAGHYTYWDYQGGAWPQNKGIRIDHFLLSPALADRLQDCRIDKDPRSKEKASDHTPIMIKIQDTGHISA